MSGESLTTDPWSRRQRGRGSPYLCDFDFHGVNTPIIADFKLPACATGLWIGERCTQLPLKCLKAQYLRINQVSMSPRVKSAWSLELYYSS